MKEAHDHVPDEVERRSRRQDTMVLDESGIHERELRELREEGRDRESAVGVEVDAVAILDGNRKIEVTPRGEDALQLRRGPVGAARIERVSVAAQPDVLEDAE